MRWKLRVHVQPESVFNFAGIRKDVVELINRAIERRKVLKTMAVVCGAFLTGVFAPKASALSCCDYHNVLCCCLCLPPGTWPKPEDVKKTCPGGVWCWECSDGSGPYPGQFNCLPFHVQCYECFDTIYDRTQCRGVVASKVTCLPSLPANCNSGWPCYEC